MPFRLIKGRFHVVNYAPDGDTVRFQPDDESKMSLLSGKPPEFNGRRHVSLRLESIDTLETHFGALKQPPPLTDDATDFLLENLGITNVVWSNGRRSVVSADDGVVGYILARTTDKFGRVIAFVYPGDSDKEDGASIFFEEDRLTKSLNFKLAAEGLAYPTYYWGLFADLRNVITEAVVKARSDEKGVYAVDKTNAGFQADTLKAVTDEIVMMPKLFRRLSTFIVETGGSTGFKAALEANEEPVLDLREQNFTNFDTFVEESGGTIRLARMPEELVFDPMPQRLASDFPALLRAAANPASLAEQSDLLRNTNAMPLAAAEAMDFRRRVEKLRS